VEVTTRITRTDGAVDLALEVRSGGTLAATAEHSYRLVD
jgi:hypothetical protein